MPFILHLFGIGHEKLTCEFQGLDQKLTGVLPAKVVDDEPACPKPPPAASDRTYSAS